LATNPNIIEKGDVNIQESKLLLFNERNLPSSKCKNITPSTSRSSRIPTQSLATNFNIIDDDVNFQAFQPKLSNKISLPSLKRKNITFSTSRSSINSSINTQTFASESPNLPLTPVCTSKWK